MAFNETSSLAGLVKTAYDRYVEFALRSQPLIRSVADKRPTQQAMPGSSVVFSIYNDLAPVTGTLTETTDPDAVALSDVTPVTVTLNEYGNASLVTRKLQLFSLSDVDPAVADIIAFNMADSLDGFAMTELRGGTNVIYGGTRTSTVTVTDSDVITTANIRKTVAKLRSAKAVPREGNYYWCGIHPEVSHDLRAESGAGGWQDAHKLTDAASSNIWAGSIGTYEGAMFIETPRMSRILDGADQSALTATALTTGGVSGEYTVGIATSSVAAINAEVGDKVGGTNVGASAKIASIATSGANTIFTLTVANSGTVSGNITVTPVTAVYRTILAGKQALAEAVAQEPNVVIGPVTDKLMRFRPIGWYGVLGFKRYREAALYRLETGSSISSQFANS